MEREDPTALKQRARDLGFLRVGVAAAGRSPHADPFLEWLAKGRIGSMEYLARNVARRVDPRETVPGARSVIALSLPYEDRVEFPDDPSHGKVARYARGRDYHKVIPPLLEELCALVRDDGRWRAWYSVDAGPILERDWAAAAGVGWIGKNALIVDREVGTYTFLAVIVTDRAYAVDAPATDHCGTCRACLDACPTNAFVAPHSLDAERCISYLTIEHRGALPSELAGKLDGWVFGCDVCQEVCPYNQRRQRPHPEVLPDLTPRSLPTDLTTLAGLDRDGFVTAFAGTALVRTGVEGLRRNARANLGASGDPP
ncbi:MAG: tRNA epoxyqueuosine(34) reductase QueG [Planctomycetota bacterium]